MLSETSDLNSHPSVSLSQLSGIKVRDLRDPLESPQPSFKLLCFKMTIFHFMFFAKTTSKQAPLHSGLSSYIVLLMHAGSTTPANESHSLKPHLGIMCHIVNQLAGHPRLAHTMSQLGHRCHQVFVSCDLPQSEGHKRVFDQTPSPTRVKAAFKS